MKFYLTFFSLLLCFNIQAQKRPSEAQIETIKMVVEGYNKQDFKQMKKPWGFLGQVLVTPKRLQKEFAPFYDKNGKAGIDTISCFSSYQCTALLSLEKNQTKRSYLNFIFNNKAKLQGFGFGGPLFIYRSTELNSNSKEDQHLKQQKIDSVFKSYTPSTTRSFSGCMIVQEGEKIIYKNCNGYSDKSTETPLNDSSMFLLASCSKQYTAMGIMILSDRKLISDTTKVISIIKDFPYEKINIKHLLSHTSGLDDYMPLLKKHWDENKFATNGDIIRLFKQYRPDLMFSPGSAFDYSNTGYIILSQIIQEISGMSYADFMQKEIFDPLQMNRTRVIARRKEGKTPENYALGYVYSKGEYQLPDSLDNYDYIRYMDGLTGDDGVSSCLDDQVLWNNAIRNSTLISQDATRKMISRNYLSNGKSTDYGYGLFVSRGNNLENLVYHTGYWPGYTTINMNFIDKNISVVLLSNNSYRSTLNMADKAAAIILQDE